MKRSGLAFPTLVVAICFMAFISSCAELTSLQSTSGIGTSTTQPLTESDVISGLKAALEKGASYAASQGSKEDGYFGNSLIKIPFPPDAEKAEEVKQNWRKANPWAFPMSYCSDDIIGDICTE